MIPSLDDPTRSATSLDTYLQLLHHEGISSSSIRRIRELISKDGGLQMDDWQTITAALSPTEQRTIRMSVRAYRALQKLTK